VRTSSFYLEEFNRGYTNIYWSQFSLLSPLPLRPGTVSCSVFSDLAFVPNQFALGVIIFPLPDSFAPFSGKLQSPSRSPMGLFFCP